MRARSVRCAQGVPDGLHRWLRLLPGRVRFGGRREWEVYEVGYDSRGLLHLGMDERSEVFDNNRLRVTPCVPPVRLATTQRGVLACITPVNEEESKLAAKQTPIETTLCAILEHPSAFNNKLVRFRGYASGNFEY